MHLVRIGEREEEPKSTTKVIERVTEGIAKCKKSVILVGAGISTQAGIPDFRSKQTGIYSSPPSSTSSSSPSSANTPSSSTLRGPAMFSASVYASQATTSEHLKFLSDFKDSLDQVTADPPTATHGLMGLLKRRGQLRRCYTQNIDGLEGRAGLKAVEIEGVKLQKCRDSLHQRADKGKGKAKLEGDFVQLHGSIYRVRCIACDYVAEWTDEVERDQSEGVGRVFRRGEVADCPQCSNRAAIRAAQRKRSLPSRSFLRPAITLYEENSPAALSIGSLSVSDLTLGGGPDLMLVMGTSLKIPGFKKLVKEFGKAVKAKGGLRILVNREEIKGQEWNDVFDYHVLSDTEVFTNRILSDWKRTRPRDWVGPQTTLFDSFASKGKNLPTASKPRSNPDLIPRPPLRSIASNTILPPLPPLKSFRIVADNPWSTVEYASALERPSKRYKPASSCSPSKPRTSRTSQAARTPLLIPDLSSSPRSSSPFPFAFPFPLSTPSNLGTGPPGSSSPAYDHSPGSPPPQYQLSTPSAFRAISPIKHSMQDPLYRPFRIPFPFGSSILHSSEPSPVNPFPSSRLDHVPPEY